MEAVRLAQHPSTSRWKKDDDGKKTECDAEQQHAKDVGEQRSNAERVTGNYPDEEVGKAMCVIDPGAEEVSIQYVDENGMELSACYVVQNVDPASAACNPNDGSREQTDDGAVDASPYSKGQCVENAESAEEDKPSDGIQILVVENENDVGTGSNQASFPGGSSLAQSDSGQTYAALPTIIKQNVNSASTEMYTSNQDVQIDYSQTMPDISRKKGVTIPCPQCFKMFTTSNSSDELERHVREHLKNKGALTCGICGDEAVNKPVLDRHVLLAHPECERYVKRRSRTSRPETEMLSVEDLSEFIEDDIVETAPRKIDNSYYEANRCPQCTKCFSNRGNLRKHIATMHSPARQEYPCDKCDKKYQEKGNLKRHVMVEHGDENDLRQVLRYQCLVCHKRFVGKSHLDVHMRTHTGEKPFRCKLCNKCYSQNSAMHEHIRTAHSGIRRSINCKFCKKSIINATAMRMHVCEMHPEKVHMDPEFSSYVLLECTICKKTFGSKARVERHILTHTGERPWFCDICGMTFTNKYHAVRHKASVHKPGSLKQFRCMQCKLRFDDKEQLDAHECDPQSRHACEHCDEKFFLLTEKNAHKKTAHKSEIYRTDPSKHQACNVCSRMFKTNFSLVQHMYTHFATDTCVCKGCRDDNSGSEEQESPDASHNFFESFPNFMQHMKREHITGNVCKLCNTAFDLNSVPRHCRDMHCLVDAFRCLACGMTFDDGGLLRSHLYDKHTAIGLNTCCVPDCKRAFKKPAELKRHMLRHNGERAFVCYVCGLRFTQENHLKRHVLDVHEKHKCPPIFQCLVATCLRLFHTRSGLLKHSKFCATSGFKVVNKDAFEKVKMASRLHLHCYTCKAKIRYMSDTAVHAKLCTCESVYVKAPALQEYPVTYKVSFDDVEAEPMSMSEVHDLGVEELAKVDDMDNTGDTIHTRLMCGICGYSCKMAATLRRHKALQHRDTITEGEQEMEKCADVLIAAAEQSARIEAAKSNVKNDCTVGNTESEIFLREPSGEEVQVILVEQGVQQGEPCGEHVDQIQIQVRQSRDGESFEVGMPPDVSAPPLAIANEVTVESAETAVEYVQGEFQEKQTVQPASNDFANKNADKDESDSAVVEDVKLRKHKRERPPKTTDDDSQEPVSSTHKTLVYSSESQNASKKTAFEIPKHKLGSPESMKSSGPEQEILNTRKSKRVKVPKKFHDV